MKNHLISYSKNKDVTPFVSVKRQELRIFRNHYYEHPLLIGTWFGSVSDYDYWRQHYTPQESVDTVYTISCADCDAYSMLFIHPEDEFNTVPDFFNGPLGTIARITKSIIIAFYAEYKHFYNLEICQRCGQVFIAERSNRRRFCSDSCRKSYHASTNVGEKSKCRKRQNAWANYIRLHSTDESLYNITGVSVDDCRVCMLQQPVAGGQCPMLVHMNPTLHDR